MKKTPFEVRQPQDRVSTISVTTSLRSLCGILCTATAITGCTTTEQPGGGVYIPPANGTDGVTATGGNPNAATATGGNPSGTAAGTGNTGVIGGTDGGGSGTTGTASTVGVAGATTGGATTGGATTSGGVGGGTSGEGTTGMSVGGSGGTGGGITVPPGEVTFENNVRVDDSNSGQQTEVTMDAGPDGLVMAGWMDFRNDRTCAFSVSTDGGATWSENMHIRLDTGDFVGDPAVAIGGDGRLYAGCQEYGVGQIRLTTSTDKGETWSQVRSIQSAPDKPWLEASPTEPGVAFLTWLGGDAGVKRTTDGGDTWGPVHSLGFLNHGTSISAGSTGLVHLGWTPNGGPLRYARSTDHGATWEDTRTVAETGTFCWSDCSGPRQHPIVGGGADPTGKYVALTWPAQLSGNNEDIWLVYSSDGGDTWTDPLRVNDDDGSARQMQPWVAVDTHGRVHVAWTDMRNDGNETWYARSANPSEGFEANVQVTDESGSMPGGFLGDYKGITISGTDVIVVWQDTRNDSGDIYAARALNAAGP